MAADDLQDVLNWCVISSAGVITAARDLVAGLDDWQAPRSELDDKLVIAVLDYEAAKAQLTAIQRGEDL